MSISTPPARTTPAEADEVAALRGQIESLQRSLAHATALLRTTQETCMVWEQTFNSVSEPIAVISNDYRVLRANAAYRRLLGDPPPLSEWHVCYDGAAEPCERCPLGETVLSRRPGHVRSEVVVPVTGLDGAPSREETRTVERWIYPIVNADGTVDRVVEIVKDVTEEVQLREATNTAAALRKADHLKAELLGTVSHELRSPLAAIQGYAETLLRHEKRLPTSERHEFLAAIQEAGTRLSTIVDRMLELSELETGSYPLRLTPVDLVRTAHETLTSMRRTLERDTTADVSFALRLEDAQGHPVDALPLILGDARLLRDLFDHLIENAVKYSPAGGTVAVTLRPTVMRTFPRSGAAREGSAHAALSEQLDAAPDDESPASVEMLEVAIQDHGMGIPADHLPHVFERFHQVDSGLTRQAGGMGLGLAVCQRIAELHHGAIWAESTPGDGSTFHVALPLAPATA